MSTGSSSAAAGRPASATLAYKQWRVEHSVPESISLVASTTLHGYEFNKSPRVTEESGEPNIEDFECRLINKAFGNDGAANHRENLSSRRLVETMCLGLV